MEDFRENIDSNTLIPGHFKTRLSTVDSSSKQNVSKDYAALNNSLDQMDLTDFIYIYNISSQRSKMNILF